MRNTAPIQRALAAFASGEMGCIEWSGRRDRNGYGKQGVKWSHRLIYELAVGPIPSGLELDHLCRNIICCNPRHLEPVTHAENMRRTAGLKTHCAQGHEYTPENTCTRANGARYCGACNRERARAFKAARRLAKAGLS